MKRRLVIITEIISPYRIPLFNALSQHPEVDLHVIFLSETDPSLRQWQVYKGEIRFSWEVLSFWRRRIGKYNALLNRGVSSALAKAAPHAILCGGYSYVASWQALSWARAHNVPFLLWSESNLQDQRAYSFPAEFLKKRFLNLCTAFVVPGRSAREYLKAHNVGEEAISTAPNAVDNELFAKAAELARRDAASRRQVMSLPQRYFLFVGRLVREKGVFELLSAYGKLDEQLRRQVGLVFAGDGPARSQLQEVAAGISPGTIRFPGFVQRDQLGTYYGLSDMLALPTYTDTWGMVVNEAMACALPVIVSHAAGCAVELVRENWNGTLVSPRDIGGLELAMKRLAADPDLLESMGANSSRLIQEYSPEVWSNSIANAILGKAALTGR